jgi:hypothetical protein
MKFLNNLLTLFTNKQSLGFDYGYLGMKRLRCAAYLSNTIQRKEIYEF